MFLNPRRENIKKATYTAGSFIDSSGAAALIAAITPVSSARGLTRFGISTLSVRNEVKSGRFKSLYERIFLGATIDRAPHSCASLPAPDASLLHSLLSPFKRRHRRPNTRGAVLDESTTWRSAQQQCFSASERRAKGHSPRCHAVFFENGQTSMIKTSPFADARSSRQERRAGRCRARCPRARAA